MKSLAQDVRFALRTFLKTPVFTAVAIVSLALGIGANSAIFSLVNQLILQPLPIRDPQSVVLLAGKGQHYGSNNGRNAISYPMYQDIRDRNTVFSGMMARYSGTLTVGVSSHSEVVTGEYVSGNYFQMLGIGAALGRVFTAQDDLRAGAHPYAVLTYAYWQSAFAGNPNVIGQVIRVNNYPLTIVGVSKKGFDGMEPGVPSHIQIPLTMSPVLRAGFTDMYNRRQRWVNVYGRLKPGITAEQAKAGLQPLFHQIIAKEVREPAFSKATAFNKEQFLRMWMEVLPGSQGNSNLRRQYEKPLWMLMGVTGLVLLIACANLASLLAARAAARQKEVAIRLALGSSRGRLIQQLLTESMLLSIAGGTAGIALTLLMVRFLLAFMPATVSGYNISGAPDSRVLLFTLAVSLATGILFGLFPALQSTRPDVAGTLKDESAGITGSGQISFRKVLVVLQVALSLVLLIGASLFIRTLGNLRSIDPGFKTANVIEFGLSPRMLGYNADQTAGLYRKVEQRFRATPGVIDIGFTDMAILRNNEWDESVTIEGYKPAPREFVDPHFNAVSPGYFKTMSIHILNGRDFSDREERKSQKVAIVNASFAKKYFTGRNVVGAHIGEGSDPGTPTDITIIGVVNDTRYEGIRDELPPIVYLCTRQRDAYGSTAMVQWQGDPKSALKTAQEVMHDVDPTLPLTNLKTMDKQVDESLVTERMIASLSSIFGALATGLVLIGLFGVMTYMVTRRSREIGIRMALGALSGDVVWLVMKEVLALIAAGIALGLPAAYVLTRLVQTQLYGVQPTDPASILTATVLLAAVTAAAGYLPARRATLFDPLRVLRYD